MDKSDETASEFLTRLRNDPAFRCREDRTNQMLRQAEVESERKYLPVLRKLAEAGFEAETIYQVADRHAPLPSTAVEILLSAIPDFTGDDKRKEMVVRQLSAAAEPFDGKPLAACYDQTTYEGLKFAILNTIACTMPHSIADWLCEARRDPWVEKTLRRIGEDIYGERFARYLEGVRP